MRRINFFYPKLIIFFIAVAVIGLPLTSFPLYSQFFRAIVAPFSALPIFILIIIWFVPHVLKRGSLPIENQLLFFFILLTLISSAAAYFIDIPTFKGSFPLRQEIRAALTLAIGVAFWLIFSSLPVNENSLKNILKYIHIGGLILILIAAIQSYFILNKADYPTWFWTVLDWLSIKPSNFYKNPIRVSGLAYEASWFAHQMACFYLPFWLAATVERESAFKFRFLGLSVENILLPLGIIGFFMSSPRISFVSLALVGLLLATIVHRRLTRMVSRFVMERWAIRKTKTAWVKTGISLFLLISYVGVILGVLFLAAQRDWRVKILITRPPSLAEIKGILAYNEIYLINLSNRLAFFERMLYWLTGLRTFNQHPWLGVGLGNSGFFFQNNLPALGYYSYEIREVLYRLPIMPNIKNLWIRLLAETGLVGFSIFSLWLYNIWHSARLLYAAKSPTLHLIARAGQFALLAFIGEGFSIDSFAMPYLWVITGLVSASAFIYRQQLREAVSTEGVSTSKPDEDKYRSKAGSIAAAMLAPKEPEQSVQTRDHPHTD